MPSTARTSPPEAEAQAWHDADAPFSVDAAGLDGDFQIAPETQLTAEETLEHGGLVADLNQALTGSDFSDEPPPGWIDAIGHLTGPGADTMAELLHELGYEAAT